MKLAASSGCGATDAGGVNGVYITGGLGTVIKNLRRITQATHNKEPRWRHREPKLTTGYKPKNYAFN